MGKKNKLEGDYPIDFELIGVVSALKEYKLGWNLNQLDIFHLVKGEDVKIEFANDKIIRISNLVYETDYTSVHLLRNKLFNNNSTSIQYLLPELQQFDYLIKLKNAIDEQWASKILNKLKESSSIDYAVIINVDKIKAKENLIF